MKSKSLSHKIVVSIFFLSLLFILFSFIAINNSYAAATIKFETPVTVKWTSNNVNPSTCTRTNGFTGWPVGASAASGNIPYSAGTITPGTYTFTFSCLGATGSNYAGQSITAQNTLTVKPPDIKVSFTPIAPPSVIPSTLSFSSNRFGINWGQSYTLSWNFSGTEAEDNGTCTASGNWSGTKPRSGSQNFYTPSGRAFDGTKSHTLTCTADNGSITRQQTVQVEIYCDATKVACV